MKINEFFAEHNKIALAFSGGADSSYLLYAAVKCGADVAPYFVKSQFQPEFEREDAYRLARELGVRLHEIDVDVLQFHDVTVNPSNRCYFCKRHIMGAIREAAAADGYDTIMDGTNANDEGGDRPGMKVLAEEHILSPLRTCGISKSDVRRLSHEAGCLHGIGLPMHVLQQEYLRARRSRGKSYMPSSRARRICFHWVTRISVSACVTAARCCNSPRSSTRERRTNLSL